MKALIITADRFEDSELQVPYKRLREADIDVDIASPKKGIIVGKHGAHVRADKSLDEINPDTYDALILPGGRAPEVLREEPKVLEIVRRFFKAGKPVAAICHGPQILLSAGVIQGKHATAYRRIADELIDAGVLYEDRPVVVDGHLITSRHPDDLDAFTEEIIRQIKAKRRE